MLQRLRSLGTPGSDLCTIYTTFILPTLMYASPVWSSSLNLTQKQKLERVQKRACRIILGPDYQSYNHALSTLNLPRLCERHREVMRKFGEDLVNHSRYRHFLPPNNPPPRRYLRHVRRLKPLPKARTDRYKNSTIQTIVQWEALVSPPGLLLHSTPYPRQREEGDRNHSTPYPRQREEGDQSWGEIVRSPSSLCLG